MTKSATDVMQEILFSAVLDSIAALKTASKGLPNNLLRDLNAIHANTTLADMPQELQAAIQASVRAAFTRLLKEGYSVSSATAAPAAPRHVPAGGRDGDRRPPRPGGGGPRGGRPPRGEGRPPRGEGRPPRGEGGGEGGRGPRPEGGRPPRGGGRPGGGGRGGGR